MVNAPAPRVDKHGDALPDLVLARLGTARFHHGQGTSVLAVSPDGRWLAAGDRFGSISMWDADTGSLAWRAEPHSRISSLVFSPDGRLLASGGSESVVILETSSGERIRDLREQFSRTSRWRTGDGEDDFVDETYESGFIGLDGLAFSPDGRTLAAADYTGVSCIWQVASGELSLVLRGERVGTLPMHEEEHFCSLAYSDDGVLLAVGGWYWIGTVDGQTVHREGEDGRVSIWDVATGRRLRVLDHPGGMPLRLAFSIDGKSLVSINDNGQNMVFAWDLVSGRELARAPIGSEDFPSITVAYPNEPPMDLGRRLAVTGRSAIVFPDGERYALDVGWDSGDLAVRSLATDEELGPQPRMPPFVIALAFTPDGSGLVTAVPDEELLVWDVAGGEILGRMPYRQEYPRHGCALAVGPRWLAVACRGEDPDDRWKLGVRVLEWATGRVILDLEDVNPEALAWLDGDAILVVGTRRGEVRLIDPATGRNFTTLLTHGPAILSLAISPDGSTLASGDVDGNIRLWDWRSGRLIGTFEGSGGPVMALTFSAVGSEVAAAHLKGDAVIRDIASGAILQSFDLPVSIPRYHAWKAFDLAASNDGKILLAASASFKSMGEEDHPDDQFCLYVWDLSSGKEIFRTLPELGSGTPYAFAPDARFIASRCDDGTILIWALTEGRISE